MGMCALGSSTGSDLCLNSSEQWVAHYPLPSAPFDPGAFATLMPSQYKQGALIKASLFHSERTSHHCQGFRSAVPHYRFILLPLILSGWHFDPCIALTGLIRAFTLLFLTDTDKRVCQDEELCVSAEFLVSTISYLKCLLLLSVLYLKCIVMFNWGYQKQLNILRLEFYISLLFNQH